MRRLNGCDTLLSALDKDLALKINAKAYKAWIHSLLDDIAFIRQLSLFCRVSEIPETALELYSQDYLTHPEFQYDEEFSKKIVEINKRLSKMLGHILREYNTLDQFEV